MSKITRGQQPRASGTQAARVRIAQDTRSSARHEIRLVSIADLTPWNGNPRRMTEAARAGLEASIERFGLVQPIVWNQRTRRVVGGHQRLEVLRARGAEQTEVVVVDLGETEERALNLALNNRALSGDWTPDAREILEDLSASFDAFKDLRFDVLIEELGRTNLRDGLAAGNIDEDEAVEPPEEPKTRPGDLWILGPHRLLCGDSTDPVVLQRLLDGARADGLFADPPYNVDYCPAERGRGRSARTARDGARYDGHGDRRGQDREVGGRGDRRGRDREVDDRGERRGQDREVGDRGDRRGQGERGSGAAAHGRILNDALPGERFLDFLRGSFTAADGVTRPGAGIYICGPAGWEARHFWAAWPEAAWHFQVAITWDKGRFALSRWDYHPAHEVIFYGWKRGAERTWLGDRKQSSVWSVEMGSGKHYVHPTQKPVALVRRALLNSVPEGGLVLDPFGGSGSTLIAAETCGRQAFLCEMDPRFVDAAIRRWERYTGQKATIARGRR